MKLINRMIFIKKDKTKEFVDEWNKNIVGNEFLDSCKKAGELFDHENNNFFLPSKN